MYCCTLLYVHYSIAIILMGKRELIALLNLSSWCLVMVERLFLTVPRGCLQFVIVVFPDHTHLLFLIIIQDCVFYSLSQISIHMIRETFDCNMQDQLKLSFSPSYSYRNKIISRKISTMFALGMRRSKLFPHDNLCCSDIKKINTN